MPDLQLVRFIQTVKGWPIKLQTIFDLWSIQKQEQDLIIWQKSSLQMHGFLHEMRKCCIFRSYDMKAVTKE